MGGNTQSDDADYERRHAAWERKLLHPHMETELEWLRTIQSTVVDAGLKQISVRKFCLWFNVISLGLGIRIVFQSSETGVPSAFWIGGFVLANVATLGLDLGVAISVAHQRSVLSKINERARTIDSKLNGDMAVGSAIDKRIW
jgi:hypothetical protein